MPSPEYERVERPLIEQLQRMGWQHIQGDINVPDLTGRRSFREVLLLDRLRAAVRRINLDKQGRPWLDEARVEQAVGTLRRLGAHRLMAQRPTAAPDHRLHCRPRTGPPVRAAAQRRVLATAGAGDAGLRRAQGLAG